MHLFVLIRSKYYTAYVLSVGLACSRSLLGASWVDSRASDYIHALGHIDINMSEFLLHIVSLLNIEPARARLFDNDLHFF